MHPVKFSISSNSIPINSGASSLEKEGLLWKAAFDNTYQNETKFSAGVGKTQSNLLVA